MAATATRPSRKTTAPAPQAPVATPEIDEMDALIAQAEALGEDNQDTEDPTGNSTDIDEDDEGSDAYPGDEDEEGEDDMPSTVISAEGVTSGRLNADDSLSTKEEKEGVVATGPTGPVVGSIRTADGKKVTVRDAKPPREETEDEKVARLKREIAKANEESKKAAERQLTKITTSNAPIVQSLLGVFESGEQIALKGIRDRIGEFSDDELLQIDKTARTAESTGWRMANTVRHEIVMRLRKGIEDRQLKNNTSGVLDEERVKKNLVGHMGRVAGEMGISTRELYNSSNLEEKFFHRENLDPDGNVITRDQIDQAIQIVKGRTFLVEALLCDHPSPAYALLLIADKKLAMPKYGIRDAREDVKSLNAGTYGLLADGSAQTPEDLLDKPEASEDLINAPATGQAVGTTKVADLRVSDISGMAAGLVSVIVDIARKLNKKGTGKLYIYQDERRVWTAGTSAPKIVPGQSAAIWLTVEPDNIYFSADIAD